MKLLCLSNGHGEDAIALRILQQLQQYPAQPKLVALPLVGEGHVFAQSGIPVVGPVKQMPSGGFVYMDGRQLARDLRGGLLKLTLNQLKVVKAWAKEGGTILAVGDIVPLLFAWWSGAPYAFVGTAKSEYYLQDEVGQLPRKSWFERLESWSGSVYLPWERWLMSRRRCRAVFPRDALTTRVLQRWKISAFDLGNPMMDGLESGGQEVGGRNQEELAEEILTFVLLPGSRAPEAYDNWQLILQAVAATVAAFPNRKLLFLGAIAPSLDTKPFHQILESYGWCPNSPINSIPSSFILHPSSSLSPPSLLLTQAFNDCLQRADFAIAMAGTATEQFVGLGKPAITVSGKGPQFTPAFAEAQTRLLGPSAILAGTPEQTAAIVRSLLRDPDRLQLIAENGRRRMGTAGAAQRIASCLMERLADG